MQKLLTFFSKNISVYVIFNDQCFNDMLTIEIVSFEQLGPDSLGGTVLMCTHNMFSKRNTKKYIAGFSFYLELWCITKTRLYKYTENFTTKK